MYNQKLELNSGLLEDEIKEIAERYDIDYEDFFLHFSEDAMRAGFALYQPPWDTDVFKHFQQGGALYLYHSEQFDSVDFKFSRFAQGGNFEIEYPFEMNANNQVTAWAHLVVSEGNTENMTQNQALTWQVPSDWVRASTHDGSGKSYGGLSKFWEQQRKLATRPILDARYLLPQPPSHAQLLQTVEK